MGRSRHLLLLTNRTLSWSGQRPCATFHSRLKVLESSATFGGGDLAGRSPRHEDAQPLGRDSIRSGASSCNASPSIPASTLASPELTWKRGANILKKRRLVRWDRRAGVRHDENAQFSAVQAHAVPERVARVE